MGKVVLNVAPKDVQEGKPLLTEAEGKKVMVVKVADKLYALDAVCSHMGGPLEKGQMNGYEIKCPWHGAVYDVRTGKVSEKTPWGKGQQPYKVDVENGKLVITV